MRDGQLVIYFKGGETDGRSGYAHTRWIGGSMVESDIYINTTHEEKYGRNLARTEVILSLGGSFGVYGLVNSTYLTIVHEVGHALGLKHVPVSGNIMSYQYMPGVVDAWKPTMSLFVATFLGLQQVSGNTDYSQHPVRL